MCIVIIGAPTSARSKVGSDSSWQFLSNNSLNDQINADVLFVQLMYNVLHHCHSLAHMPS